MTATDKLSERTLRLMARAEDMQRVADSYGMINLRNPEVRSRALDIDAQAAHDLAEMSATIDRLERIA